MQQEKEIRVILTKKVKLLESIPNAPYNPAIIFDIYFSKNERVRITHTDDKTSLVYISGSADKKHKEKISIFRFAQLMASKKIKCMLIKSFLGWLPLEEVNEYAYVELIVNAKTGKKLISGEFEVPESKYLQVKKLLEEKFGKQYVTTKSAYDLLCK